MVVISSIAHVNPSEPFHKTMFDRLLYHAKEDPHKAAILVSEKNCEPITYAQLHERCTAVAAWFQKNGYKKGDIILLCIHNSWEFIVTCLAAWTIGITVSAASPQFSLYEVAHQYDDSTAVSVVTEEKCLPAVLKATKGKSPRHIICLGDKKRSGTVPFSELLATKAKLTPISIDMENDLIILPYSSGTTGTPKGVMITHLNYAHMLSMYIGKYDDDFRKRGFDGFIPPSHTITFLPLYHAMGLFSMIFHLYNGTVQILMRGYKEETFLKHVQDYQIMAVTLVPSLIISLASSPLLDKYDLSSLLVIASGSAPLSQSVMDKLKQRLPDVQFAQGYGMTETSVASHIGSPDAPSGSIGTLVAGTMMKVISENGEECGPYQEGEMWLKGPQIMKGYWRRQKQTDKSFDSDGFMRTGDIVYYDENGHTFITDRVKELIKVHGKQVAPAELEDLILELPSVRDCCVIGIPHEKAGEVPLAFVVGDVKEKDVQSHVNARVASYKRLGGGVQFVTALPRTPTGKLLRRKLKQEYLQSKKSKL